MPFVDYDTMIELKGKVKTRFERDEAMIKEAASARDQHTLCRLSMKRSTPAGDMFKAPLFKAKDYGILDRESAYTFCLGNKRWYCKNRNGNGFPCCRNDYLHQKKRYTSYRVLPEADAQVLTWRNLLEFLLGEEETDELITRGLISMDPIGVFPGLNRSSPCIEFTITIDPDKLLEKIAEDGHMRYMKRSGTTAKFVDPDNYFAYRGKIYVAENAFIREKNGTPVAQYAERIFAYAHLFVYLNSGGDKVFMYVGQLKD